MIPSTRNRGVLAVFAVMSCWLARTDPATVAAQPGPASVPAVRSAEQLACLPPCALEGIYRGATAGAIPIGFLNGIAVPPARKPGSELRKRVTNKLWLGKEFRADQTLVNHWRGMKAIKARVCLGPSWIDGRPAIVMDYRGSSLVWHNVRDEMREVAPGVYLGLMFRRRPCQPRFRMYFVLQACTTACGSLDPVSADGGAGKGSGSE